MRFRLTVVVCALAVAAIGARAEEKAAAHDNDAMMQKWMEMTTPGPEHADLAKMAGSWNANVKNWMDPSQPPMEMTGSSEMRPVLGGRYIEQTFHGEMMGQPFEGLGYTGYDKVQKKFISLWMDNMSTGWMMTSGDHSKDGKTSTMTGMASDPMSGGPMAVETTMTWVDTDHVTFEMWQPGRDGKKMKSLEIMYSRQK